MLTSSSPRILRFFEVYPQENLKIIGSNLPQSLNLRPKTATLILTSNFEAFWGFFKINLKYFSLPSTSKKPQTFFEVFLEDPRKPHAIRKILSSILGPVSRLILRDLLSAAIPSFEGPATPNISCFTYFLDLLLALHSKLRGSFSAVHWCKVQSQFCR